MKSFLFFYLLNIFTLLYKNMYKIISCDYMLSHTKRLIHNSNRFDGIM